MNATNSLTRWSPSRIAVKRAAARGTAVSACIHHLPMVSTAVLLLVLIMVTAGAAYSAHHGRGADLPRTDSATPQASANREDTIKVTVTRDGKVFFRRTQVMANDLPGLIREAVHSGSERKVYLAVDARARNVDVATVLDQIPAAGITQICVLAERVPLR